MRDIWSYIKECVRVALAIRERQQAVIGMLAAILALPIVWALGGTLEFTAKGVAWAAAWATISTLLNIFVVAPFFLWRKGRGANLADQDSPPERKSRISYYDFAVDSVAELSIPGVEAGFYLWDFNLCIRQCALDGTIVLEGRDYGDGQNDPWLHTKLLKIIGQDEWEYLEIDFNPSQFNDANNANSLAWRQERDKPRYRDLHFHDAAGAKEIFSAAWPTFKGVNYAKYLEAEAAKAARNAQ